MAPDKNSLKKLGRKLRSDATFPERLLWSRLRRKQLGPRFLRQRPVGDYVVDFTCPSAKLIVEVDGRSHDGHFDADMRRQADLESEGYTILRFSNDEVIDDVSAVVKKISAWLENNPALSKGGG